MANHGHRDRLLRIEHQLSAFREPLGWVHRFEAHQLLALFTHAVFTVHAAPADPRERFGAAHTPAHVQIVGGHGTVSVLANNDEALLGPQHVHGLGAVGGEVVLLARLDDFFQHAHGVIGLDIDLIRQLTGKRDAEHPRRHTTHQAFFPGHERERLAVQINVGHFAQQLAAVGAGQGQGCVVVGDRSEVHLQLWPFGLLIDFQPLQHAGRTASGGGHHKMVVGQAGRYAVVEDHAVFFAHQAVAGLAHVELGPGVGVDTVEKFAGIRALNVDFAQGRGIEHTDAVTYGLALALDRRMHIFAITREVPRAFPLADIFKFSALLHMPGLQRGVAHRLEDMPAMAARYRAKRHRRVVGAEHGGAHLRDGHVQRAGGNRQAVDVAQFALVGAETQCGVALDVLHRLEALAGRQFDGRSGNIVLQVDKLLGRTRRALFMGHMEQRQGWLLKLVQGFGQHAFHSLETCFASGTHSAFKTIRQAVAQRVDTVDTPYTHALLRCFARHEPEDIFAPGRLAAQVRGQMHHRAVAAGSGQQIALQPLAGAGDAQRLDVNRRHPCTAHMLAATGFDHRTTGENANALGPCFFDQRTTGVAARIGDGNHLLAGVEPVQRHAVGMVVVGTEQQLFTRCHAITAHIGRHRTGEHIARHVVVAVHQRPLAGAGGQYHALGPDPVDTLAYLTDRGAIAEVVGETFVNGQEVVVVVAVHRRPGQQDHVWQRLEFSDNLGHPLHGRLAVQAFAAVEQAAAELFLFVGDDHPRTAAARSQCCGQPRRASTDDQHVAVVVHIVVGIRIVLGRRTPKTSRLADVLLVGHPERLRVHKGFVVKARRHQLAADLAEDTHHVVIDVGPAVGAGGDQTLVQRLLRGTHVGDLRSFGGADLQHRVGFFGTGGVDAPGPGIFETAADHVNTVGQQCGRQAVAFVAFILLTVEGEAQYFGTVNAAAIGQAMGLAHTFSPSSRVAVVADGAVCSVNCGLLPIR